MKIKEFYLQEPINVSRQVDVDVLKMVSILFMVVCHSVMFLSVEYESTGYFFASYFLGSFLGAAPAFMISMGLGIVFTRNNDPKSLFKRGLFIFILAYVFNFFRIGIPALIYDPTSFFDYFLQGDILQFAGLAFMAIALCKKLKLKSYVVLLIALVLSCSAFLFYGLETDNANINYFINLFYSTSEEFNSFSFVSWFIFVVVGMFLGNTIQRIKNLDKFYLIMMIVSLIIAVPTDIAIILFIESDLQYYGMVLPVAIGFIATSLLMLSAFHFLVKIMSNKAKWFCKSVSTNITPIYFIHWCFIGPLYFAFSYSELDRLPMWSLYVIGIVLFVISYLIALLYQKVKKAIILKVNK